MTSKPGVKGEGAGTSRKLSQTYKLINPVFQADLSKIAAQYEKKQAALLPTLHYLQEKLGFISTELEEETAHFLEIPSVKVREVVSFYHMFRTKLGGRHEIKLCQTLSCHLTGCGPILEHLEKTLGIRPGETTKDGRITLEVAECLGACEISPMMQVDKKPCGPLTVEKVNKILSELK